MSIETVDNLIQLLMALTGTAVSAFWTVKYKKTEYMLLMFYYVTAVFGVTCWFAFLLILQKMPTGLPVAELSWVTAYLFLVLFLEQLLSPPEKKYRSKLLLIPVVVGCGFMIYFCMFGDYLLNITWIVLVIMASYISLRSLLYQKRQGGLGKTAPLHIFVLVLITIEYFLWLFSCFSSDSTLANPYYWMDFLVSLSFIVLLPVARRAVEA